jgi:magnesium-transporting ATPase (P-type)
MRFLMQVNNVLIYVLLAAAVGKLLLGEWLDAFVILGVVIINALLGFIQEGKAEKALDSIRNMLSAEAMTVREGNTRMLPAEELVPGDVVLLQSGDKVPADIRLCEVKNLRVEEAPLTGESVPVDKIEDPVDEKAQIGDRKSMPTPARSSSRAGPTGLLSPPGQTPNWGNQPDALGRSSDGNAAPSADREVREDPHHHNPHRLRDHLRVRPSLPGHRLCGYV